MGDDTLKGKKALGYLFLIIGMLGYILTQKLRSGISLLDMIFVKYGLNIWSDISSVNSIPDIVCYVIIVVFFIVAIFCFREYSIKTKMVLIIFICVFMLIIPGCKNPAEDFYLSKLNGIGAVEYLQDKSRIKFNNDDNTKLMHIVYEITLKNHSNKETSLNLKIELPECIDSYDEEIKNMAVLIPKEYLTEKLTLLPKGEKKFTFQTYNKLNDKKSTSGEISRPKIIIYNDNEEKEYVIENQYVKCVKLK